MTDTHLTFRSAIVRPPASNFADGLTTQDLGAPSFEKALQQHAAYCQALRRCGLEVIELLADPDHPDSTFVEDTAILTPRGAILARPGAASREGEVQQMRSALAVFYDHGAEITPPGTLDGGDICEAGEHFFIGVSQQSRSMVPQRQSSTTETTMPQSLQPYLAPLRVAAFLAGLTAFTVLTGLAGLVGALTAFLGTGFLATAMGFTS